MQLYLIRHAESENNARPDHLREEDPPITTLGQQQAECLASWVQTLRIDALITSPFLRTLQTTRAVTDASSRHVHVWHDVFERGGCFRGHGPDSTEGGPGLGTSGIHHRLASENGAGCTIDATIGEEGWWFGNDRETDEEAVDRAKRVTRRFADTFGDSDATVVSIIHADLKRLLLIEMLKPAIDATRLGPLRNTGITKLNFDDGSWSLDWFNSISHLPVNLIGDGEGHDTLEA